ncbi:hypothetical protein JCM8547_000067 [Rhodosporidiobolus lusitaniae]
MQSQSYPASLATPAPLPSSSNSPSSSSRLETTLSLQHQLQARLQQSSIALRTLRKQRELARDKVAAGVETSDEKRLRRERQRGRILHVREEIEREKERRSTRSRAVEALDRSHLIDQHLHAQSSDKPPSERQTETQTLISRRDALSLDLLQLQTSLASLKSQRTQLRKKLLILNRENAAYTAELREARQPPEELVRELPAEVRKHYDGLLDTLTLLTARLSIIRNVFQRLVVESGVPYFLPSSSSSLPSPLTLSSLLAPPRSPSPSDTSPSPMTDQQLLRLLLLSSDSALDADDWQGGGGGGVGTEEGQRLPKELRGAMEEWREARESPRVAGEAKVKRTRTV